MIWAIKSEMFQGQKDWLFSYLSFDFSACVREALIDSGVSILIFSTFKEVFSLLKSMTGLHLSWGSGSRNRQL